MMYEYREYILLIVSAVGIDFFPPIETLLSSVALSGLHPTALLGGWQHGLFYVRCGGGELCQTGPF